MLPLYQMLTKAGDGRAIELMARQYRLTQEQTQLAAEALLPAFKEGLRRNASDPYGMGALMAQMASGDHAGFFEDAARAFAPEGKKQGEDILGQLFGSPEVSRAVAAQAAQATGIAQETLKAMLPAMAAMLMGGLNKQASGEIGQEAGGMPHNPFLQAMQEIMRAGMTPPTPTPTGRQSTQGTSPFDNPFARIMQDMMEAAQPKPEPPRNPSGRPRNTYDDLFSQMFETGRQTREDYERGMREIFERFGDQPHPK
jgi:hypothetical protein